MHWYSIAFLALAVTLHPSSAVINSTFLVNVIRILDNVYDFNTFPIFISPAIKPEENPLEGFFHKLAQDCPKSQMHFTRTGAFELKQIIDRGSLSIIFTDQMPSVVLEIAKVRLRGMHLSKILLVFREPVLLQQLTFFKTWLWDAQFINVLVLFEDLESQQNQIFTIDPYPRLVWANRTSMISEPSELFAGDIKDMKNYFIETPYMEDAPRVFPLKKDGKNRLVGRHGNLIVLFAKHMNIQLSCKYEKNLNLEKILRKFHDKKMELSVHSYSMFDLEEIGSSYPLETVRWCIMVPLRSEVPKSEYVIIAFDLATWLVICFSVIYIAYLMRFIDPPTSNIQKLYFLRTMAIIMYSPNMAERMTSPSIRQFIFFALVFLLGFILSCIYLTYVTSFCTNMVFQPPIDTVEDLIKEHLRVMVIDYELEAIRERATYGETFLKLLYPVSYFEVINRRNNFDGHYAYSIRQDRWHFLDKQQRGLEKPFFRLSKICFGRHYTMFPLQYDSHLQPYLDNFILLVMQAGLDLFWDEDAFRMAVATKYSRVLVEQTVVVQKLRLDYFKYVYAVWAMGIIASIVCFIGELFWTKFLDIKKKLDRINSLENN